MNNILITGGAGYIGSHLVKNLLKEGYQVTIVDNLSTGFVEPIKILKNRFLNLEFYKCDLGDKRALTKIFNKPYDAVIHLAAKIDTRESVQKPELYYQNNFLKSINLIEAMTEAGARNLVFSSTAAVYGNPKYTPIDEKHPTEPLSPYGQSKLDFEKYLSRVDNLNYIIFRYFNIGGSDPEGLLGKSHINSEDIIENIIKVALLKKENFEIFGDDFKTPDGTAIRDYVHVEDICLAHLLALKNINSQFTDEPIFNLGSENGFSVKEILDQARITFNLEIPTKTVERRPGDMVISVASAQKAKVQLGWIPQYSNLKEILKTDWNWRKDHPLGYTK